MNDLSLVSILWGGIEYQWFSTNKTHAYALKVRTWHEMSVTYSYGTMIDHVQRDSDVIPSPVLMGITCVLLLTCKGRLHVNMGQFQ